MGRFVSEFQTMFPMSHIIGLRRNWHR